MRYADKIEFFEQLEEQGKPTPLSEMPDFDYDVVFYINAFNRLTSSRNTGFGIGTIPLTEMKAYIELVGYLDSIELFIDIILVLDNAFIEHHNNKNNAKQKARK